jgi:hypothetical protein
MMKKDHFLILQERTNKACVRLVGSVQHFTHFSGFVFFLLPSFVHTRPIASIPKKSWDEP